ncbi:hypothetical protein B0H17DRAFT_1209882 [Mycena rosella]|uniref:Protein AF-9 homolog n=1 Tax=Mycena rosella TaxID=1033263 RepID=A0AAD7CXJ4_MYCRO|nr:hypothetical protein B0H17DRAFT_1209882 [Mycena rosella]
MATKRVRVRDVNIYRPIIYDNTATVLAPKAHEALAATAPDHTHTWTVTVRGTASAPDQDIVDGTDDLSHFIKHVTFKLHNTYPNPSRNIDKPRKPITLYHHLKLHPWTASGDLEISPLDVALKAGPVHSWQYDELVLNDPFETFLATPTGHPPTSLVRSRRKPVPFHLAHMGGLEVSKGGTPEFTVQMEKEEAERLEDARKTVVAEEERCRMKPIEREKELEHLQKTTIAASILWLPTPPARPPCTNERRQPFLRTDGGAANGFGESEGVAQGPRERSSKSSQDGAARVAPAQSACANACPPLSSSPA